MLSQKEIDLIDSKFLGKCMTNFRVLNLGGMEQRICSRKLGKDGTWLNQKEMGRKGKKVTEENLRLFLTLANIKPSDVDKLILKWMTDALKARLQLPPSKP